MALFLALILSACASAERFPQSTANANGGTFQNELKPFTTDGCSDFADGVPLVAEHAWLHCCVKHDLFYWKGGSDEERLSADQFLKACVSEAGYPEIGNLMYAGVRVGGAANLPTTFHWGYGWVMDRGTALLSPLEKAQVAALTPPEEERARIPIVNQPSLRERETITGDNCADLALNRIYQKLGRPIPFSIESEDLRIGAYGRYRNLSVRVEGCRYPFRYKFLLKQDNSCQERLSEVQARRQIKIVSESGPDSCGP